MNIDDCAMYYDPCPAMVWIFDASGRIFFANRGFSRFTGLSVDALQSWADILHPDDKQRTLEAWTVCVATRIPYSITHRVKTYDGKYRWCISKSNFSDFSNGSGRQLHVGMSVDIEGGDDYAKLIREITTQKGVVASVVDQLPIAAVVGDAPSGRLLFTNREKLGEVFGLPSDRTPIPGTFFHLNALKPDGTPYEIDQWPLVRSAAMGERVVGEVVDVRHNTGRNITVSLSSAPVRTTDGEIVAAVMVCENLEEKLASQRERLNALNTARVAEESARMKSNFIANMSHDIRTPINGILGMAALLASSQLSVEQSSYIATISECGRSLIGLINDILDLSKIEAGKMELDNVQFSLRDTLQSVTTIAKASLLITGRCVNLKAETRSLPPFVKGDPKRLEQILTNLISNAIKFSPDNAEVVVDIYVKDEKDPLRVFVCGSVKDSGIGIDEQSQARLFEPFTQAESGTTRQYGGTGLGLSICKKLVSLMDGKIWLTSQLGQGSEFFFEVKLGRVGSLADVDGGRENERTDVVELVQVSTAQKNAVPILLAEDNKLSATIAKKILKMHDYTNVDWACNGEEAVRMFFERQDYYRLILMDCQMPVVDGFEATRRIRAQGSKIAIVAFTASATQDDRDECRKCGMDDILLKPFEPLDLIAKIQAFVSN